jgi:putative ABC transport system ATP-binding protein
MEPLYQLEGVTKRRYRSNGEPEFELLVSRLFIPRGGRVAVVGPSGSGKSTLLDLLVLTSRPSAWERFEFRGSSSVGLDVGQAWDRGAEDLLTETRKRHIGVVLQTGGLLRFATVRQNIEMPRRLLGLPVGGVGEELATYLGIAHLLNKLPENISVGERQRVAIARALAHEPLVLVADEPTASLDHDTAKQVAGLLMELADDRRLTIILSTHDEALIRRHDFEVMRSVDLAAGAYGWGRTRFGP